MNETRAKDLLQAKALGCLDAKEDAAFLHLMEEDNEFPWEELGQYQNLVSLMPTLLNLEIPDPEVKNKVLAELRVKTEDDHPEEPVEEENVTDSTETLEIIEDEEIIIEEEDIVASDLSQVDEVAW
ncbi:MAG: hypothetical protein OEM46_10425, partial [Ignavibacteria bacterium]|nr:hypothetical protein [Ignavibacteria bacterium]